MKLSAFKSTQDQNNHILDFSPMSDEIDKELYSQFNSFK